MKHVSCLLEDTETDQIDHKSCILRSLKGIDEVLMLKLILAGLIYF